MSSPYLLYVTASPMGDNSRSRALGEVFLNAFKEKVRRRSRYVKKFDN